MSQARNLKVCKDLKRIMQVLSLREKKKKKKGGGGGDFLLLLLFCFVFLLQG